MTTLLESQAFVRAAVGRALAAANLKQEAAAEMIGLSPPQFSRQLAGLEHLSMQRLMLINDPVFWRVFLAELRTHFAVQEPTSREVATALSALMASLGRVAVEVNSLQMAKATLPAGMKERRRRRA